MSPLINRLQPSMPRINLKHIFTLFTDTYAIVNVNVNRRKLECGYLDSGLKWKTVSSFEKAFIDTRKRLIAIAMTIKSCRQIHYVFRCLNFNCVRLSLELGS